ncbi:MAG TPA: neocarzinostatin apoprotein domain-containing protein [Jatrophihabitans sp.]|nr:neocarzinostatin apoprotein domain-containing protein [Jatrophihabitans sp.]
MHPRLLATVLLLCSCGGSGSTVVVRTTAPPPSSATTPSATTPAASAPAGQPRVRITPSTGLRDQQQVQVVAAGFTPGEALQVIECAQKGTATGPGDCNLATMLAVTAGPAGELTVRLPVLRGPFGANNIVCGAKQACIVSVTQASLNPTQEADAPIAFAA